MTEKEFRALAIDTVVSYAEEQGVKIRRSDFVDADHEFSIGLGGFVYKNYVGVFKNASGDVSHVMVKIAYTGRWEAQLKAAKERFLNYFNARLEPNHLSFSFSAKELEIIAVKKNGSDLDNEKIEAVIQKINKLLALADNSRNNSEQEAIAASLHVQKLLAKYNLSMADVTGERQDEDVEQCVADVGTGKKWKYSLANAISANFACKHFVVGREQIVFYGYKADIVAARRVYVYLFKVGDRLATQYTKKYREEHGVADGIYNSFCGGFVAGVKKELDRQCKALAIIVQPKVQEQWDVFSEGFGKIDPTIQLIDPDAYGEGVVEGKRALNAQYIEG